MARKAFRPNQEGGDPLWNEARVFSRWEAWQYLIARALYAPRPFATDGGVITIRRGETPPLSIRYLMRAWGWGSKKRVSAFLQWCHLEGRLRVQQRTTMGDTYLLVNYDAWQFGGDSTGDSTGYGSGDSTGDSAGDKKKLFKDVVKPTNTKNDTGPTDTLFETAWTEYPRKHDKAKALKAWNRLVGKEDMSAVAAGIQRYAAYTKAAGTEPRFVKHLATLLGPDAGWREEWTVEVAASKPDEYDVWMAKTQAELV
jgi:hypothetical protein